MSLGAYSWALCCWHFGRRQARPYRFSDQHERLGLAQFSRLFTVEILVGANVGALSNLFGGVTWIISVVLADAYRCHPPCRSHMSSGPYLQKRMPAHAVRKRMDYQGRHLKRRRRTPKCGCHRAQLIDVANAAILREMVRPHLFVPPSNTYPSQSEHPAMSAIR